MPTKKHQYDLVQNDDYDTRIPLHPDEAFHHGINFHAKYIGMLDVPRPSSRVEIVAAMRRIRYEFKAKGIKKKKVTIEVSVDGVKVTLRKKKKSKHWDDNKSFLLSNPIYRIFYVSHDSQDLKIFSYIARDGASNVFKCAVFKSNKKSQALRVVRTIGQAFEVCHKLSINAPENERNDQDEQDTLTQDLVSDRISDITSDKHKKDYLSEIASDKISLPDDYNIREPYNESKLSSKAKLDILAPPPTTNTTRKSPLTNAETYSAPHSDNLNVGNGSGSSLPPPGGALSAHHEIQLMREQLEQQNQQTQAAMAQLQLAREQLAAEQSARLEAQARTHQLLVHNRELLDHIAALVAHLQGNEKTGQQQNAPHMAMPQQQNCEDNYLNDLPPLDNGSLYHSLIENRAVTSPLRASYPGGNIFNFTYPSPLDPVSPTFDPQLFYSPYFNYNAHLLTNLYASPYATLQRPPKKLVGVSRVSPTRNDPYQPQAGLYNNHLQMQQRGTSPIPSTPIQDRRNTDMGAQYNQRNSQDSGAQYNQRISQDTGVQYAQRSSQDDRTRMINTTEGVGRMMGNLRTTDDLRLPNGPPITRTTSEKVPNRSELMSQVQRTLWARHTTK